MTDSNSDVPNFRTYEDGEPIPPVDPEDVKQVWKLIPPWRPGNDQQSACSPGANVTAVTRRSNMIGTLKIYKLLTPWQHGEELDDAVFRIAATFPIQTYKQWGYMMPGDEKFGFDPNAFVQRLIDETGIPHVWERIATKVPEGTRAFGFSSIAGPDVDPDKKARHEARQLLWMIWERCCFLAPLVKDNAETSATLFADLVMENIDLLRQVEDIFKKTEGGGRLEVLMELERKAQEWRP